jgi:hypothetical protein
MSTIGPLFKKHSDPEGYCSLSWIISIINNKIMKKYILIFAISLCSLHAPLWRKTETPTENYVVLTSNVKQLKPIF